MCYTYRVLESMDSNFHLSMFSPALEKATSRPEVDFPSVFIKQSTPSETVEFVESSDDDSDAEYFDALTGEDLSCLSMEALKDSSSIKNNWSQDFWSHGDWPQEDWIQQDCSQEDTDSQTEVDATSEDNDHPFAGWHSHRLVNSDWVNHSFIDKTDHIDTWARRSASSSLARCNWVAFPEDGWPKPENDYVWGAPEAPELRLVTPEGDVWWLDDPVDYEALPWEREVAEERNRILSAIW